MLAEDLTTDIESEKEVNVVKLKRFHCPFCESSFSSPTRLICHLNQHVEVSIEDGVNCCDILYHDTKTFVKHLEKAHVKNSSKKNEANTCRSCGFTAQGKDELKDHITKLHVKDVDVQNKHDAKQRDKWQKYIPAVCPECNKTFSNKYNMLMHMKSHRGVTEKYPCDRCSKTYKSKASLKSHQEIAHKGILSFVCSYCGEAFPSRIARDVHKRIHTGDKPYTCKYCDRSYRAKNTLDRHLEIHLNVRKYECYICSKRFRKSTHLKYHLSTWTPSSANYDGTYRSRIAYENEIINDSNKNIKLDTLSTSGESVDVGDESENDDRPLAAIASEKSNDLYKKFYNALVNFRNHYATEHERNTSDYLEFTDSTDSEVIMDDDRGDRRDGDQDINNFDDLTEWNMRKGKMDEETRLELNEVQRKIDGKIFFACKICDKNLSTAHTYIFHKRIHTGERPCVCHVCGKQFRTPNGLQRHLTETHQRLRRHSCSFCPKNFANTQNLKQHLRIHTGERPFVCSHCGKRFTQSGSLHVHLKTHSEQYPFQCAECGAKFRLRSGLSRHRLKHTGERPHVCVHCGKAFRQKHDLHSHALAHTNLKPHVCLVCGAAFRQLRALKHHYKRVHQSEPPKQLLNDSVFDHVGQYQINFLFSVMEIKIEVEVDANELENDVSHDTRKEINKPITITNDEGKKYAHCHICDKNISFGSWKRHMRAHIGEKRYSCHTCGLAFNDSGNLARHSKAIHAKHRPFSCPVCDKTFSRNAHLRDHMKSHSESRDFVCDICGKASKSSAALRMHRKIHQEECKYSCIKCGAKFKRSGELRAHVTVHTGEKAHSCSCGKSFRLRSQLNAHYKTHGVELKHQ
ncbi:zinc finger protein 540-like [Papilio machaon]|uniref:zinc finger protein 540-like n=1 Tax=Papilio machaon TaxID=76193 RepID=UPI001E665437|nr:zinc finger protein 540-like [Papilio machaon]